MFLTFSLTEIYGPGDEVDKQHTLISFISYPFIEFYSAEHQGLGSIILYSKTSYSNTTIPVHG